MSLLTKWGALAVGASYVLGRGMYLRKVSWYDRPWAVVAGVLLVLVTTALVLYDATGGGFIGRIEGGTSLHVTALLLGTTWFTHGALLYTRG